MNQVQASKLPNCTVVMSSSETQDRFCGQIEERNLSEDHSSDSLLVHERNSAENLLLDCFELDKRQNGFLQEFNRL